VPGNILRLGDWISNLDKVTAAIYGSPKSQAQDMWGLHVPNFWDVEWRVTEVVLILEILETGVPGSLYLVRDRDLWNTEAGDGNEPIHLTVDSEKKTLMEVTNMDLGHLKPYGYKTKNRAIELKTISSSKLEIAQSGVTEEWNDDVPPVGLHPFDRTREAG
jgi:hypothetical protein